MSNETLPHEPAPLRGPAVHAQPDDGEPLLRNESALLVTLGTLGLHVVAALIFTAGFMLGRWWH